MDSDAVQCPAAAEGAAPRQPAAARAGGGTAPRRARLHPLTLALPSPELEAAFWREAGTPAYALSDRVGLAFTSANHVFLWWAMRTLTSAERMMDACPSPLTSVANANHLVSLSVALATFAASLLAPARYRAVREPLAIGQRLLRAVNTPIVQGCTSAAAYHRRIARDLAGAGGGPMAPAAIVVKHASLLGVLWAIQVLVFAFRVRWAAPVQIAAAVAGVFAMHGFACAARAEPAVSAAAAQLCDWVQAVSGEAFGPAWPRAGVPWGLCTDGAVEFLVVLIASLSSSLSLYVLYCREERHKLRYLESKGLLDERDCQGGPPAASGLRHAAAATCCVVASIFAADTVASFGWRFSCS
ncbi:hypothetical protein Rsub_00851 [Raphidocelis subcapitata]|uniref:Uncharacterized protein n=1 Tax=Raphidocelis subcapitata TaxID=307507 RepID=A0A2V0NLX7_9CHLO|nr:hypothetical protein Rsub_00851 [Raphidocelis subcapitata]|eukprot:GBF88139.1 hypothetical protein Rsub_00851 [Raphidocelis subcapitata]